MVSVLSRHFFSVLSAILLGLGAEMASATESVPNGYFENSPDAMVVEQELPGKPGTPPVRITAVTAETAAQAFALLRERMAQRGDPATMFRNTELLSFLASGKDRDTFEKAIPTEIPANLRSSYHWPAESSRGPSADEPTKFLSREEIVATYDQLLPQLTREQKEMAFARGKEISGKTFNRSFRRYQLILINGLVSGAGAYTSAMIANNVHWGVELDKIMFAAGMGVFTQSISPFLQNISMYRSWPIIKNSFLKLMGKSDAEAELAPSSRFKTKFFLVDYAIDEATYLNNRIAYSLFFPEAQPLLHGVPTLPHEFGILDTNWSSLKAATLTTYTQGFFNENVGIESEIRNQSNHVLIGYFDCVATGDIPAVAGFADTAERRIYTSALNAATQEIYHAEWIKKWSTFLFVNSMLNVNHPVLFYGFAAANIGSIPFVTAHYSGKKAAYSQTLNFANGFVQSSSRLLSNPALARRYLASQCSQFTRKVKSLGEAVPVKAIRKFLGASSDPGPGGLPE